MENISFDLYRLFYCVANCNTISKAAELLYISQPAVTQGIKKLEDQIEGKLFYRTNKGIELTEEGKRLYQYIEKSIQILDNTHQTFNKYINLEEGLIKIRSGNMIEKKEQYKDIARFMKDFPNIEVQISDNVSSQSIEDLTRGKCDIVFLNLPFQKDIDDRVVITKLYKKNLELYCTKEYYEKFIKKEEVGLKDLNGLDFIYAAQGSNTGNRIVEFFNENELKIKPKFISASATERQFMAEESLGILVALQGSIDSKKLIKVKLKEKLPSIDIGMATLSDEIIGYATRELVKYIKGIK